MPEVASALLRQFNEAIVALVDKTVRSTAIVTAQTRALEDGGGSAWLYDAEHLVTNHHVVADLTDPIHVQLPGGVPQPAVIIGHDALTDLAVLRIDPQTVSPLALSETGAKLGELCFAFGCPLGHFPESISIGIVSGLKRELPTGDSHTLFDVIQTDAAINPGNSGGPLVNTEGRVIGVNTAGIDGADGIGFAIPAETVAEIVDELITYGAIERASLGVRIAKRAVRGASRPHALVVTALRANPAGPFKPGDVLISIGGRQVESQHDLLRILRREIANRKVKAVVLRDGNEVTLECLPRSKRTYGADG
ncbi:trypsin-like peptidase domain-containing protein [Mycolicibacterium sp.]|uniref:S1C family serine protease n=1 Tax=Mycolicibacterium sp. TaxID=2320850 RepID=UPI0025D048D6|nr:trypsin-like peptidase domain-containing protein [Mycolicibacterium sp.]MCB9409356.1 trypsin-like peptidase domain-containing protein [Mycolicibacterium sp.]